MNNTPVKLSKKARLPMRVFAIQKVLPYIIDFKAAFGVAPSYREIAKAFNKKSVYTASLYLQILVREGYVKLSKRAHRRIEILRQPDL